MIQIKKKGAKTFASYKELVEATHRAAGKRSDLNANTLRIPQREDSFSRANRKGEKLVRILSS